MLEILFRKMMCEREPTTNDMRLWCDDRLMFRAVLLAVMCVDRRKHCASDDATLMWADESLTTMTPLLNERIPLMDGSKMPLTATMFSQLAA